MLKHLTFDNIYKMVVIIAIGYLIFSVLNIFNLSSKNIDKIEENQQVIMQSAKEIIENNNRNQHIADSIDQIRIQEIQQLTKQVNGLQNQLKSVQSEIKSYKQTFDKNKVDLPNPWQN